MPLIANVVTGMVRGAGKFRAAQRGRPLSSKRGNRRYFKGNESINAGRLTSKGRFIVDPAKLLQLEVPDLTGFELKPYVSRLAGKYPPEDVESHRAKTSSS